MKDPWNNISDKLPEPYEKVLTEFRIPYSEGHMAGIAKGGDQTVKEFYSTLHFVAYMDEDSEWSLYYLYNAFKLDKTKLIPVRWMKIPK